MTDNTQELDDILTAFLHDCSDYEQGKPVNLDMSFTQTKKRVLDWHNKQIEAVLDRLEKSLSIVPIPKNGDNTQLVMISAIEAERNKLKESN